MGFKEELLEFTQAKILFDEPMKKHSGYGLGGSAKYYIVTDNLYTIKEIISLCACNGEKLKIIGNGSNILVSDVGFNGVILNTSGLKDIEFLQDKIRVSSGVQLSKLIRFSMEKGLSGLEPLTGIPATVGGAIVMNAGAFGHTISDYLVSVEVLTDGKIVVYNKEDCGFRYRKSNFYNKNQFVISATFQLEKGDKSLIQSNIENYKELRKNMHPTGRSCGSVFKNPKTTYAGALIECAGLKGFSVGGATVSNKHANFIVVDDNAKAQDVYSLIQSIKNTIKNVYRIELNEEIEFIGDF